MALKEQPKRLGRGLAALLGDAAAPPSALVQSLGVEQLEPSPFQPRREMDEGALAELAASITQRGVLQPLLVRPHPSRSGHYQIIAGERRWRAAQLARLHEVPVLLRALSDTEAMAAGLVENLQREDLNPVEEAQGYRRLIDEFKMTQDVLADAIGKSRAHVGSSLRLLNLSETVLAFVRNGALSFGHARAIMTHPDPEKAARQVVKEGLNVRQTEALARRPGVEPARNPSPADAETDALARQLSEKLGVSVKVTFNGKAGAVIISYRSLDQLDEVLALLNG